MFSSLKLQVSNPAIRPGYSYTFTRSLNPARVPYDLRQPARPPRSLAVESESPSSSPSNFTEAVGTPSLSSSSSFSLQWNLTHRHIVLLNVVACAAFKRAAESLEKLMDTMREELPDTMAAVRLSGMEISDLTMELSDIGQEITQGVKSSTRAVRVAEERLRRLTTMAPTGGKQSKN